MNYIYKTIESTVTDEAGAAHRVYGVAVFSEDTPTPECVINDIFSDRDTASRFVSLCNRLRLDPDQLWDAVQDVICV